MRALLAFDKFKHSMTAAKACSAAADALAAVQPLWDLQEVPLTDGGEGFAEIFTDALGGDLHTTEVLDACFRTRTAQYGVVPFERIPVSARARLRL